MRIMAQSRKQGEHAALHSAIGSSTRRRMTASFSHRVPSLFLLCKTSKIFPILTLLATPAAAQVSTTCQQYGNTAYCQSNGGIQQPDNSGANQMLQQLGRTAGTQGEQIERDTQENALRQQQLQIQQLQIEQMQADQAAQHEANRHQAANIAAAEQHDHAEYVRHENTLSHVGTLIGKGDCEEGMRVAAISGFDDVIRIAGHMCAKP